MSLPLENLSKKQVIIVTSLVAVVGIGLGLVSGTVLKATSQTPTTAPGQSTPQIPTYSGRIFPAVDENKPARFTHKLIDSSGEVTAYLTASDDKLKIVLPTTTVTVEGAVVGKQANLPIIRVEKIKF